MRFAAKFSLGKAYFSKLFLHQLGLTPISKHDKSALARLKILKNRKKKKSQWANIEQRRISRMRYGIATEEAGNHRKEPESPPSVRRGNSELLPRVPHRITCMYTSMRR